MPQVENDSKTYLTYETALRKAQTKMPPDVRWLIQALPGGRFAPVIIYSERHTKTPAGALLSLGFLVTT